LHAREVRRRPRLAAAVSGLALLAGLTVSISGVAHGATPPPNPTNHQLATAAQQKAALATEVGRLTAQTAVMQTELQQLQANQELMEQKFAFAWSQLQNAKSAAVVAKAGVVSAQKRVDAAQTSLLD
jgi:peptidoglycan DL-endopeptidase RipA